MARGTKTLNSGLQVNDLGNVFVRISDSEPEDSSLGDGQIVFWADAVGAKLMVKAKFSGAIASGEVADLAP